MEIDKVYGEVTSFLLGYIKTTKEQITFEKAKMLCKDYIENWMLLEFDGSIINKLEEFYLKIIKKMY